MFTRTHGPTETLHDSFSKETYDTVRFLFARATATHYLVYEFQVAVNFLEVQVFGASARPCAPFPQAVTLSRSFLVATRRSYEEHCIAPQEDLEVLPALEEHVIDGSEFFDLLSLLLLGKYRHHLVCHGSIASLERISARIAAGTWESLSAATVGFKSEDGRSKFADLLVEARQHEFKTESTRRYNTFCRSFHRYAYRDSIGHDAANDAALSPGQKVDEVVELPEQTPQAQASPRWWILAFVLLFQVEQHVIRRQQMFATFTNRHGWEAEHHAVCKRLGQLTL